MTTDLPKKKKADFAKFPFLQILHPNGWISMFQWSCCPVVMYFFSFQDFPRDKKMRFSMTTDLQKKADFAKFSLL